MTALVAVVAALAGAIVGAGGVLVLQRRRRSRALRGGAAVHRITLPFTDDCLSEPAVGVALRIARSEDAVLMPIYLALVPQRLPLDVALPDDQAQRALTLLEAIEQRATRADVRVDARIERGRTVRHALRRLISHERFERMVVPAGADGSAEGLRPDDIAWLFAHAPGELIALRPVADGQASSQGGAGAPVSLQRTQLQRT